MTDKERIDSLIRLAEASWHEYIDRRAIEWKVNFGLWLALGTFAGFMFQQEAVLPLWIAFVASLILLGAFLIYTFLWKVEIQRRNQLDKEAAHYYWIKADEALEIESPPVRTHQADQNAWRPTHLSQVLITFMFTFMAVMAVWVSRWAA